MTDKLLSTEAAAELRGCTTGNIRYHLKPDKQEDQCGRKCNFYLTSSVKKLDKSARIPRKLPNKKIRRGRCKEEDDPYNVMDVSKPTYRGRKCPGCGEPIETGKYKCNKCSVSDYGMRETEDVSYSWRL